MSSVAKTRLATWFMQLPPCCLCAALGSPLRSLVNSVQDLTAEDGIGYKILQATFSSKNTNVTVENAFARAASSSKANRGRNDHSHTLMSKHVLAEMKFAHKTSKDAMNQVHCNLNAPEQDPEGQVAVEGQIALSLHL